MSKASAEAEKWWPADRVERRKVAALIPYAKNARTHSPEQVEQLAASIREWGFTMPILVDEKDEIIAGHGRVLAAETLGLDTVPAMVASGWTQRQIKAYRLADNRLALNAAWDVNLLAAELGDLKGMENLMGFSDAELMDLFKVETAPDEFPQADESLPVEHVCPRCGYQWSGGASRVIAEED